MTITDVDLGFKDLRKKFPKDTVEIFEALVTSLAEQIDTTGTIPNTHIILHSLQIRAKHGISE